MDFTALASEIRSDPLSLGYAPLVAAGDDAGIAALLNAATGPGAATVALTSVPRNQFVAALRPGLLALAGLPAATQAKWDRVLAAVNTTAGDVTVDATTQAVLAAAVADGVLSQAQADAAWHRTGSRAEVLFGAGTVITQADVSYALRGQR